MKKRAMAIAAAFALTMSMGMGAAAKDDLVIAEMMDCGTLAPTGPSLVFSHIQEASVPPGRRQVRPPFHRQEL